MLAWEKVRSGQYSKMNSVVVSARLTKNKGIII